MISQRATKHKKIEDYILQYIKERNLQPGDRLPAEREIGMQFGVSQFPVRIATENLIERGVLVRKQGRGKFVNQKLNNPVYVTNKVGVLYTHKDENFYRSPFHTAVVAGIKLWAEREGKALVFRALHDYYKNKTTQDAVKDILRDVDGLLLLDMNVNFRDEILNLIQETGKTVVALASSGIPATLDSVEFDHIHGIREMTRFLIKKGHKNIRIYVSGLNKEVPGSLAERHVTEFYNALAEAGLSQNGSSVFYYDSVNINGAFEEFKELMSKKDRPTAVFCTDDTIAFAVYRFAHNLGLNIPGDLTITGYDDVESAKYVVPALTTVRMPLFELGEMGMKRLLEKMREKKEGKETVYRTVMPGKIVERESHKKII